MNYLILLFASLLVVSCAHQAKMKPKGQLLNQARYEALGEKKSSCSSEPEETVEKLVEQLSHCAHNQNWSRVEKFGIRLAAIAHESGWGPYFLSLAAEKAEQPQRGLWMAELAIKKEPGRAVFYYQKARLLGQMGDEAGQQQVLELGYSQEPDVEPFMLLTVKKSYAEGDCSNVKKMSQRPSLTQIGTAVVLASECHALDGEIEDARTVLDRYLKNSPRNAEVLLQRARIEETFAANFAGAASLYRRIAQSSNEPDLLAWVKSKLEYLEGGTSQVSSIQDFKKGEQ